MGGVGGCGVVGELMGFPGLGCWRGGRVSEPSPRSTATLGQHKFLQDHHDGHDEDEHAKAALQRRRLHAPTY